MSGILTVGGGGGGDLLPWFATGTQVACCRHWEGHRSCQTLTSTTELVAKPCIHLADYSDHVYFSPLSVDSRWIVGRLSTDPSTDCRSTVDRQSVDGSTDSRPIFSHRQSLLRMTVGRQSVDCRPIG